MSDPKKARREMKKIETRISALLVRRGALKAKGAQMTDADWDEVFAINRDVESLTVKKNAARVIWCQP